MEYRGTSIVPSSSEQLQSNRYLHLPSVLRVAVMHRRNSCLSNFHVCRVESIPTRGHKPASRCLTLVPKQCSGELWKNHVDVDTVERIWVQAPQKNVNVLRNWESDIRASSWASTAGHVDDIPPAARYNKLTKYITYVKKLYYESGS